MQIKQGCEPEQSSKHPNPEGPTSHSLDLILKLSLQIGVQTDYVYTT